jgi:hypothetical protein
MTASSGAQTGLATSMSYEPSNLQNDITQRYHAEDSSRGRGVSSRRVLTHRTLTRCNQLGQSSRSGREPLSPSGRRHSLSEGRRPHRGSAFYPCARRALARRDPSPANRVFRVRRFERRFSRRGFIRFWRQGRHTAPCPTRVCRYKNLV